MASHDQYPQDGNVTKAQIPHSFRHGETPHREFDNTPLTDAVEQGLIITPDSPALLMPEKKSKKGAVLIGGAVLATIATVGSIIGLSSGDNEKTAGPTNEPTVSTPVSPGQTPTNNETTPGTGSETDSALSLYGIEVAEYPTFASVADVYYKELTDYRASGNVSGEAGDARYLEALYGTRWENEAMAPYVDKVIQDSIAIINRHIATGENGDPEYEESTTVTETSNVQEPGDQSTLSGEVTIHYTDNAGQTVLANLPDVHDEDEYGGYQLVFTNQNGYWQLTTAINLSE